MFLFVSVRDGAATAAAAHASVQAEEKRIHINEFLAAVMGLSALTQAAQDEVLIFLLMSLILWMAFYKSSNVYSFYSISTGSKSRANPAGRVNSGITPTATPALAFVTS